MQPISRMLNFAPDAPPLPSDFCEEVYQMSLDIKSPETAKQAYDRLEPVLKTHRANQSIAIACGMLLEKQRSAKGMRDLWHDLRNLYPDDMTALRMLMRWHRREQKVEAGIAHISELFPESWHSLHQANLAIAGLAELKAWSEIDSIMLTILILHSDERDIRMKYIKILNEQLRFKEAAKIARHVEHREKMGQASQDLLGAVSRSAATLVKHNCTDANGAIADIIALAEPPRELTSVKRVVFFTGQLGTGGAERQMTRIACAYHERYNQRSQLGMMPSVWVKHATASSGADFYLPQLQEAGVVTRIMSDEPDVAVDEMRELSAEIRELLEVLAPDVLRHTCIMTQMFRDDQTDVAYLWQDGGVVQSAIAAVLAGVPRIITSFRGLPPNLRPNLFRPELPVLYAALARLPHVTFTANSQKAATAYEEWLSLEPGEVQVIPNAIPAVLPDGDGADHTYWSEVLDSSESCDKTVLGVFRFDTNKRPLDWINAASRYLAKNDDTRFVMLGDGALKSDCEALVEELGLTNRVFIAGIRSNVGFYMHRADLLMHLAEMEGLPNVLIEAQLAGTPVLATPAGGTDEVVTDGVTGHILSNAEHLPIAELDEKLERLLSNGDELARLGSAAMVQSGDRFSIDTILGLTTDLFNSPTLAS